MVLDTKEKLLKKLKECSSHSCQNCRDNNEDCSLEQDLFDFIEKMSVKNSDAFDSDFVDFYYSVKEKYANSKDTCWLCLSDVQASFMKRLS